MADLLKRIKQNDAPPALKILVAVVNRDKGDLYLSLLQDFEINAQLAVTATGTASEEMLQKLGIGSTKTIIMAAVREDRAHDALSYLEDKFRTIKNGKGIAFTLPMSSIIGVGAYEFLSNQAREV